MLLYAVLAFAIIILTHLIFKWRNPKCEGILPPGSSGLPFIGETLQLCIPSHSIDLHPFIQKRLQIHGQLFRTNIAGWNMVVSCDQKFNRFLFQHEEKLVVHWYLCLFEKMFGIGEFRPDGLAIHKYQRSLVLNWFGSESIRQNLLPQFDEIVRKHIHSWSMHDSVEMERAVVAIFGEFGGKHLYDSDFTKEFADLFIVALRAVMSLPLNIPGTTFHKCLKEKEKALEKVRKIVIARLASPAANTDMLDEMIKDMKTTKFVTQEYITQLLFLMSFVIFPSVSGMVTFAVKFISENPAVLHELTAEHEEILRKRESINSSVTWEEYKSMTFTLQVINETLRLGNTFPGFVRKAVKDLHVNGYTIPAGWGIMVCVSALHLDPNIYKDPLKFNPWRWRDVGPEFINKNLKPFGGGIKQCAGADLVRATMTIFLHHLVTKYRWTIVKGGDIVQNPILHLKNGLHINVSQRQN